MDWDPNLYDAKHAFVWQLGAGLIDLLAPRAGERILDLGCGTGHLSAEIAARGATVVGFDNSLEMIARARAQFPRLRFEVANARNFQVTEPFDAVFSNAALHWIPEAEEVISCVARALKPGGRFVAEFGGKGNVSQILTGARRALQEMGVTLDGEVNPWYFPGVVEYGTLLERHGLTVEFATLFDRPTPLEDGENGLRNWMRMFGAVILKRLPTDRQEELMARMEHLLRPSLWREGHWTVDYTRLRVLARKEKR